MYLEKIKKPNDIKKIPKNALPDLAQEIREFLINSISITGGHLAANLGVVELTMALHLVMDFPEDKLIWDVGHQCYTHKILTGRKDGFANLRKFGGMAGFPKTSESDCDAFNTGHSSTSISAGLGMAMARTLDGKNNMVVSVIGDGSLTGGMAYEAFNNAAKMNTPFIIILNDNNMSISENVGGVSTYLNSIRTTEAYIDLKDEVKERLSNVPRGEMMIHGISKAKSKFKNLVIPGTIFESMGITYLGPVDGHDINAIVKVLKNAKRCKTPVVVHVLTKKGKGFEPAEKHPARFHGAEPFLIENGLPSHPKTKPNYQDIFSTVMCKMGGINDKIVAITAAMPDGTGLKRFKNMYPDRFFDVGIAEEHAVTFAAGLAMGGYIPIFAVYSSFLQRGYDQIIHDVCMQKLHVVFAIDRAGMVGSDGETHQGIFDLSYLSSIPNLTVMAPKNKWELADMLKYAIRYDGPVAIRYPRGEAYDGLEENRLRLTYGKSETIYEEDTVCLYAVGSMVKEAVIVRDKLKEESINAGLVNARFVKPIDTKTIEKLAKKYELIVTMEENVLNGGFGEKVDAYIKDNSLNVGVLNIGIDDTYVEHGSVDKLYEVVGIDTASVIDKIKNKLKNK
ncbi:MAG: 1-deoxy-D-xylulose-5-phosphate synthase [Lachnospiraceae bacterium]|nr:1-deoxy-D-xylulose-5-phosphate synthase [Lachnospiraceae bacterium]